MKWLVILEYQNVHIKYVHVRFKLSVQGAQTVWNINAFN